jgi:glyoxylase-like metal-dependent hydrolase (beta-lactamase superfamily II)
MDFLRIPDGFMLAGQHAITLSSNLCGGTFSSVYLIVNKDEGCLIDTSMTKRMFQNICRLIKKSRCKLRYVLITHDHYDHVANAKTIKSKFGGLIIAHALDIPMITNPLFLFSHSSEHHFPDWSLQDLMQGMNMSQENWNQYHQLIKKYVCFPQEIDDTVEEGQILRIGDVQLQVLHTLGHSPGSISVFNPKTGSLYIGDLDLGPGRPYPIGNVKSWEESLLKIKRLNALFLGVGHSSPIKGKENIQDFLSGTLMKIYDRERNILEALQSNRDIDVETLTDILFPLYKRNRAYPNRDFTTYCHLLKLHQEGEITRETREGKTVWNILNNQNKDPKRKIAS